jgi:lipopolysaccharide export system permease protein
MQDYPQTGHQKSKPPGSGSFRMNIFQRALVREFAGLGLLIFTILLSIVVLSQLIRLLGDAVSGALAEEGVITLMGFASLNYLPVLLALSLFLSVLLTLTRSYRDSEMVVWFSSGIGLSRWVRPVLWYVLPVVSVIALLSLVLSPWALSKAEEYKNRLNSRDDVTAATPGVFRESGQGNRVYFVEKVDPGKNHISNIFVRSIQNGKMGTMVAKEGMQETAPNGDRFLVLLNGTRYEGVPGQHDFKIVQFERYAMRIETAEAKLGVSPLQSISTLNLLRHPTALNKSELEWRLGMPMSALVLALLAIPLSYVNPRAGRSLNLISALVIYMIYNNVNSVINASIGQGRIDAVMGFLGVHVSMLLLVVLLFYHRITLFSWKRLLR